MCRHEPCHLGPCNSSVERADVKSIRIIIDTDIGDDIDDAFALAFVLGSPEFEILGVTTVYGDVVTRAKVARTLCRSWGRDDIPVRMGFERPMGCEWFPGTMPEDPPSQHGAIVDDRRWRMKRVRRRSSSPARCGGIPGRRTS